MGHVFVKTIANIDVLPRLDVKHLAENGAQISVGDLHGNAVKLLYVLARHGIINISDEDYTQFVEIYFKQNKEKLNKGDIARFNQIISRIKINKAAKNSTLNLIGDELADRGMNDYFTLKLLQKLKENNIPVDIVVSNHSASFINSFENDIRFDINKLPHRQGLSANNLQLLIDDQLVFRDEIDQLVEQIYKPTLKLLNYSLNETQDRVTIYSHAAIGLNNIEIMANKLGVEYKGGNAREIAQTIEAMNDIFTQEYVSQNRISELLDHLSVPTDEINGKRFIDQEAYPFAHLIWNRFDHKLLRPKVYTDFVHGHDKRDKTRVNIYNLDNNLGKTLAYHENKPKHPKHIYTFLHSNETKLGLNNSNEIIGADRQQPEAFMNYQNIFEVASIDIYQLEAIYMPMHKNFVKHDITKADDTLKEVGIEIINSNNDNEVVKPVEKSRSSYFSARWK